MHCADLSRHPTHIGYKTHITGMELSLTVFAVNFVHMSATIFSNTEICEDLRGWHI